MSTRSQIGFYHEEPKGMGGLKKFDALVYRHWDGYPDGVLPEITPILSDFKRERGLDDTEYASAWLVAQLKTDMLNYGISKGFHWDIEYFYAVYPNKIDVYEAHFKCTGKYPDEVCLPRFKKISSVEIE